MPARSDAPRSADNRARRPRKRATRAAWPRSADLAKKAAKPAAKGGKAAAKTSPAASSGKAKAKSRHPPAKPAAPARPLSAPALAAYGKALERFRKADWKGARHDFQALVESYPAEIEIGERVRVYIRTCERNLAEKGPEPRTAEEHYQAGILDLNAGRYDQATAHLERTLALARDHDAAHYALACVAALSGKREAAIRHLKTAIAASAEHRIHALSDSDFELLRDDPDFADLLSAGGAGPRD